jgi:hypothetical protein
MRQPDCAEYKRNAFLQPVDIIPDAYPEIHYIE